MLDVFKKVKKVAQTDSSVLILGESGTGKELIARSIHHNSPRANKNFVPVNCGAIVETLAESEFFGHEKGSFTDAHKRKLGKLSLADKGSIFLDEIAELSPSMQVKFLRFLQEQKFERVGGEEEIEVDVRVIAATHQDLTKLITEFKLLPNTLGIYL